MAYTPTAYTTLADVKRILRSVSEKKLSKLCASYGKRPNKAYRINIPKKSWIMI